MAKFAAANEPTAICIYIYIYINNVCVCQCHRAVIQSPRKSHYPCLLPLSLNLHDSLKGWMHNPLCQTIFGDPLRPCSHEKWWCLELAAIITADSGPLPSPRKMGKKAPSLVIRSSVRKPTENGLVNLGGGRGVRI